MKVLIVIFRVLRFFLLFVLEPVLVLAIITGSLIFIGSVGTAPWRWPTGTAAVSEGWKALPDYQRTLVALAEAVAFAVFVFIRSHVDRFVQRYIDPWILRLREPTKPIQNRERYFPFTKFSSNQIDELKKWRLKEYASLEYLPRLDTQKQRVFEARLDVKFLLITGRAGLGKTRECIELFRRLAEQKGEEYTILYPLDDFDRPSAHDIPPDFAPRNLILFIDDIQGLCGPYPKNDRTNDVPLRTFHDRLASIIAWIKDRYSGKDYRVVLTAQDEPDQLKKIRLGADVWSEFSVVQLPAVNKVVRPTFIQTVAKHYGLTTDGEAIEYISRVSDGTAAGIINVIALESSRPSRMDRVLRLKDIQDNTFQYPRDWERKVYEQTIVPRADWRAVFEALSCIQQLRIPTYEFLVVDLAARLCDDTRKWLFGPISLWLTRKTVARAIRCDLVAWMFDYRGEIICPTAYTEGRADVKKVFPAVLSSLRRVARKRDQRAAIMPKLPWLSRKVGLDMGLAEEALTMLKSFEKGNDFAPLWTAKSLLLAHIGRHKESLKAAETACKVDTRSSSALVTLSNAQSRLGQHGQAKETARKATSVAPDDDSAWLCYGVVLSKMAFHEEAVSALQTACQLNPQSAKVWYSLGVAYDRQGHLSKSIEACRRATALDPDDIDAWHTLGIAYDRDGQKQNAIDALHRAHELDDENGAICLSLSRVHYSAGQAEEGSKALKDAESRFRKMADYSRMSVVGIAFSKNAQSADGARIAKEVLKQVPDHKQAQLTLAICLNALPDHEKEAEEARERLGELCRTAKDWFELSILSSGAGDPEEAINAAKKVLEIEPEHFGAARVLARNLSELPGRDSDAQQARKRLEGLCRTADDWCELSIAYSMTGHKDDAVNAANKALEINADHVGALRSLSRNLARIPNREQDAMQARTRLEPLCRTADDWCDLSVAYGSSKQPADAVRAAQRALDIDPNHVAAVRSLIINLEHLPDRDSDAQQARKRFEGLCRTADDWCELSIAYRKRGFYEDAVHAAECGVAFDRSNTALWCELAKSLDQMAQRDPKLKEKALQTWKHLAELEDTAESSQATEADKALLRARLTPDSSEAWKGLAVSYRAAGRAIEAVSIARQTVEQMPSLAPYCVAIVDELLNQEPQSIEPFMEYLVGLDSSNSLYLHLMGVARFKAGDAENAVEALNTACEMDSGNGHYWYALGKALEKLERYPEAQRAYEKAIAVAPDYKKASQALRGLIRKIQSSGSFSIESTPRCK